MVVEVGPLDPARLFEVEGDGEGDGSDSEEMRQKVETARKTQAKRFEKEEFHTNAEIPGPRLRGLSKADDEAIELLIDAAGGYRLSFRTMHRTLRVARTIADLGGKGEVEGEDIAEALQYRGLG